MKRTLLIRTRLFMTLYANAQQVQPDSLLDTLKTQRRANSERARTLIALSETCATIEPKWRVSAAEETLRLRPRTKRWRPVRSMPQAQAVAHRHAQFPVPLLWSRFYAHTRSTTALRITDVGHTVCPALVEDGM